MAFFVAIHQEAWPDRLDQLLGTIRETLAASPPMHPGRRSTRVFQRLGRPTQLLSLGLWDSGVSFEAFKQSRIFVETGAVCGSPPKIEPLEQLRSFERMEHRASVMACSTVTAPAERATAVEAVLLSEQHRAVERVEGLVCREVYRASDAIGHILLVHTWRSLADLNRFRAREALSGEARLQQLGAVTERFTGSLAAEFSAFGTR
jgi:heme-degrading monooxygenase HmoA